MQDGQSEKHQLLLKTVKGYDEKSEKKKQSFDKVIYTYLFYAMIPPNVTFIVSVVIEF